MVISAKKAVSLIERLKVNNIVSPMGMDDPMLRFSWEMTAGSAEAGTPRKFRVILADSRDALERDECIWDSGMGSRDVPYMDYAGPALGSNRRYWWRVEGLDEQKELIVSTPSYWDTGLQPEDWKADWIWRSQRVRVNDFAYFRKELVIDKPVISAKLFVSANHTAHVYLNGQRAGGYGSPAPTNPIKRKYYLAYDIADQLTAGTHCLTADAHYLGGAGQNYVDGLPGFRLQLHIHYEDDTRKIVKTDVTWDVLKEMPHRTGTPYQQNRRMSAIEDYDAGKWDSAWRHPGWSKPASTVKAKKSKIGRELYPMRWQPIPEGAIEEEIQLTKLPLAAEAAGEDNAQIFDVGKIVSGWPRLTLPGLPGARIRMRYSEDLDECGRVKHNVTNEQSSFYYDQYTMRGDELETWQPDFSYKAFRYVEVTGYPSEIAAEQGLVVCSVRTGISQPGRFHCSDAHMNALFAMCIQTQKNNIVGQVVDCPHREQAQYLADTDLQAEALLYNFEALGLLEKTLSDFSDAQLEDGTFPFVYPSNYEHPDFYLQIPEWDMHFATLLWKLYWSSGDERLLIRYAEPLRRMVDYFLAELDPVLGLVPEGKGWHISDWPYPTVEHEGQFLTVQQVKLVAALRVTSLCVLQQGDAEAASFYERQANRLAGKLVEHLYEPSSSRFRDSSDSLQTHQGVTAIAVFTDILPETEKAAAINSVAAGEWESKTVLSLPLLRMLFDNGREQEAYAIISRKAYPGWGYMLEQGAKTLWEGWDDIESHSHAWNGYPARLLQEYIVGIRAVAPGFAEVQIKPYLPDELDFAEAEVLTVRGPLFIRWERLTDNRSAIRIQAVIPATVRASFLLSREGRSFTRDLSPGEHDFVVE